MRALVHARLLKRQMRRNLVGGRPVSHGIWVEWRLDPEYVRGIVDRIGPRHARRIARTGRGPAARLVQAGDSLIEIVELQVRCASGVRHRSALLKLVSFPYLDSGL